MRVADNINAALHSVLAGDERAYLIGEDLLDPYGGAFKVARGLSTRFPDRVLSTPISESAMTGVAAGLALAGDTAIVEYMFADFLTLGFDPLVNFAAKSVTMYGTRLPMRLIVRCPSGGGRGYGPTHSQTLTKHLIGVPGLAVFEMSPFRDAAEVFAEMLALAQPCVFVEDKILYTRRMHAVPHPFTASVRDGVAYVGTGEPPDLVLVAPGGTAGRAVAALHRLLIEDEIAGLLVVPSRLYPVSLDLPPVPHVVVAEDGTAGGTWGAEVAQHVHARHFADLAAPVTLVHAAGAVIPAAPHLEREVLVTAGTIYDAMVRTVRG
ncbi:alpha-ketoacid dehydrogenase subunit beta [Dactylosporangium siamense]|uniref:Pyruvate dehydrogenase E1 component subunit beta n=1 Tax=Dactylosporangium siamense TaxID=685454 RepID=A0A919PYL8_9ACTN|nr:alpha-ketoacid dehydrogenase subunit beta [Dactylosporangium siamense]GIG52037.1 pyruvate dehydrogenase [Dactylosporangium siamense]